MVTTIASLRASSTDFLPDKATVAVSATDILFYKTHK